MKILYICAIIFCSALKGYAGVLSILPGDSQTPVVLRAVKSLFREHPELKSKMVFKIYNPENIKHALASDHEVLVIYLMDRKAVLAAKGYIEKINNKGGMVYGVSEPYDEEYKKMGIVKEPIIRQYYQYGGFENIKNMFLYIINKYFDTSVSYNMPEKLPEFGIYLKKDKKVVSDIKEFLKKYPEKDAPWVGLTFYRNSLVSENMAVVDTVIDALEKEGYNVLPVFGWPESEVLRRFFLNNRIKIKVIVGISLKIGASPELIPILKKIGAPVVSAISLYSDSYKKWYNSREGINMFERTWQVAIPELAGVVQPIVIGTKEPFKDQETGILFYKVMPVQERVQMLIKRVNAWMRLQEKSNSKKHIAIVYYNYPPGKQNIGASYLNVLKSIYLILKGLREKGYDTGHGEIDREDLFKKVQRYGRNIGNWAQGEIDRIARNGMAVLLSIEDYKKWFERLPEAFKKEVLKKWGSPEQSKIMTWEDGYGKKYILLPMIRYGNILLAPQPARGWLQDIKKLYHDPELPPHHQYIAFYLYLKHVFKADAVVHLGTHGTHEWLPGKEMGLTENDPPEVLIQDIPNIYPYIVDDVGEGLQAKRRGMAVVVDHMTPPFDKAGLNPEMKRLKELINRYRESDKMGSGNRDLLLDDINNLAERMGLLSDLSIKKIRSSEDIISLEDYIDETEESITPYGLHTFGGLPDEELIKSTAVAIAQFGGVVAKKDVSKFVSLIRESARSEMDGLLNALSGKYIPAGPGNDPVRAPESLPTGRNFYAFDPSKIPSRQAYKMGKKMANQLLQQYRKKHGRLPEKLSFNLWAVETIRHGGVMESQIMYLLGVKPVYDPRDRVIGLEPIARDMLGRPRIDVVMVPSGLYRDVFPNLIALLDRAVTIAREQNEQDNIVRKNFKNLKDALKSNGIDDDLAERLATVRIFTEPPGVYGTGISEAISKSDTWQKDSKVAGVFFMRVGYLFGQGFWGDSAEIKGVNLLKKNLSGTDMVVHSVSGNLYATLDNDDMFQYLGGLALAVRNIDKREPDVYITNLIDPKDPKQETLQRFMGRETRARYLNPRWIKEMLKEGYAGARFVSKVIEYLWGWQVTVPEVVTTERWQQFYETYVLDKYNLHIKQQMAEAGNLYAYQSMLARMIEVIRKGYWKTSRQVLENLVKEYAETVEKTGLTCCDHTCNNPLLARFINNVLVSVPSLNNKAVLLKKALKKMTGKPSAGGTSGNNKQQKKRTDRNSPGNKFKKVRGYEMEELNKQEGFSSAPIPYLFIIGFILFVLIVGLGYKRKN